MKSVTVLITNIILSGRSGTEILTRNIALELLRRGYKPVVYSPVHGSIVSELRSKSVPVVSDLRNICQPVDIIHGHHLPTVVTASAYFPGVPVVFFCHSYMAWFDEPPRIPSVRRYVAVDETVFDRLTIESGIPVQVSSVILNAVDIERFKEGAYLPHRPKRALAFAKNVGHMDAIRAACLHREIEVEFVGGAVGRLTDKPELLMPEYDLVFASALTAMEAMACGKAVIVCDGRGLAGFCDARRFALWRNLNFGHRTLQNPLTADGVGAEIDAYDAAEARAVSQLIRAEGGMVGYVDRLVHLYEQVIEEHRQDPHRHEDLLVGISTHLQSWYSNQRQAISQALAAAVADPHAPKGPVGDLCQVFWRNTNCEYDEERSVSALIEEVQGEPQSIHLELPPGQKGDNVSLRLDLSRRPGVAHLTELVVRDAGSEVVWEWDGRPESIRGLPRNQMELWAGTMWPAGCTLQLNGEDPWIELALNHSQSAALSNGGTVLVACSYFSSVEALLQLNARMMNEIGESRAKLQRFQELHAS